MINIIIGIAFVIGGLSGGMQVRGIDGSSTALAVIGGLLIAWGVLRMTVLKPEE